MPNLTNLRLAAREIFDEALRAADAGDAVRRAIQFKGSRPCVCGIEISNRRIYSIAAGKAALTMAYALEQALGASLDAGVIAGPSASPNQQEWLLASPWRWHQGGHPLPNRESLAAATDALQLLEQADKERA